MTAKLYSVGDLARTLGVDKDKVLYRLKTRSHIKPAGRVGSNRYYDGRALRQLAKELRTDRRRKAV